MYKTLHPLFIMVYTSAFFLSCLKTQDSNSVISYAPKAPIMQIIESDSILLNWNLPEACSNNIEFYEVFYKTFNSDLPWNIIGKITTSDNCFTLKRDQLASMDSVFEIALRSVTKDFDTSALVKSSETQLTADGDSVNGWVLFWK